MSKKWNKELFAGIEVGVRVFDSKGVVWRYNNSSIVSKYITIYDYTRIGLIQSSDHTPKGDGWYRGFIGNKPVHNYSGKHLVAPNEPHDLVDVRKRDENDKNEPGDPIYYEFDLDDWLVDFYDENTPIKYPEYYL